MKNTKGNIKDFKDRMTAPVGVVVTNPKTRKPKNAKKKGK